MRNLTDEQRKIKNEKIKNTLKATRQLRATQIPKVYEFKLQNLSKKDIEKLNTLFLQAKWFYNYIISDVDNRLNQTSDLLKSVAVRMGKDSETYEYRPIDLLGSQVKQSLMQKIKDNLKGLHELKNNGHKVGKLKFKKKISSIPLKQYGNTFKIDFSRKKIKIQGLKKKFRVLGLNQIQNNNIDSKSITKADFIKKPSGFYLHLTCYQNKSNAYKPKHIEHFNKTLGIDLGIKEQLTFSNGIAFEFNVKETKRLKHLQKKLAHKIVYHKKLSETYKSKNFLKLKDKLSKEHEYIKNIKTDIHNKILSFCKRYNTIATQNDPIKGWHQNNKLSRKVQHTALGSLKARLSTNLANLTLLPKHIATTKECCVCHNRKDISLSERTYECPVCGNAINRDLNSAYNMLHYAGCHTIGLDQSELHRLYDATPEEKLTAARLFGSNPHVSCKLVS